MVRSGNCGSDCRLGATITQGGHVSRVLRAVGLPVRGLTRNPGSVAAPCLQSPGCTLIAADMEDPASLLRALSG
ncbi:MAG: NmrA family NAD(P)-binding protein, partial [Clostridia bacterium]